MLVLRGGGIAGFGRTGGGPFGFGRDPRIGKFFWTFCAACWMACKDDVSSGSFCSGSSSSAGNDSRDGRRRLSNSSSKGDDGPWDGDGARSSIGAKGEDRRSNMPGGDAARSLAKNCSTGLVGFSKRLLSKASSWGLVGFSRSVNVGPRGRGGGGGSWRFCAGGVFSGCGASEEVSREIEGRFFGGSAGFG